MSRLLDHLNPPSFFGKGVIVREFTKCENSDERFRLVITRLTPSLHRPELTIERFVQRDEDSQGDAVTYWENVTGEFSQREAIDLLLSELWRHIHDAQDKGKK